MTGCFSIARYVGGLKAGEKFFLLPNLSGKHKTDRRQKEKVLSLCYAAEIPRPAGRDDAVVVPDAARRFPREKAIERFA